MNAGLRPARRSGRTGEVSPESPDDSPIEGLPVCSKFRPTTRLQGRRERGLGGAYLLAICADIIDASLPRSKPAHRRDFSASRKAFPLDTCTIRLIRRLRRTHRRAIGAGWHVPSSAPRGGEFSSTRNAATPANLP